MGTPSSQQAADCPISFVLDDSTSGGAITSVSLVVRPEDLSRQDPSRLSVQQTLGGAWADNFGAGLAQINISGHTGWHSIRGSGIRGADADGVQRFQDLRETVFDRWHARRELATLFGLDPNGVKLIFADGLNKTASVVAPVSFTLRRSRSRPLLAQYQIGLVVLAPNLSLSPLLSTLPSLIGDKGPLLAAGLQSMALAADKITAYAGEVNSWVNKTLGEPVRAFMLQTAEVYRRVDTAVRSINGVADSLIGVARDASRAGMNIMHSIAALANIPSQIKARVIDVATAFRSAYCALRAAVSNPRYYEDYNPLYGASNCSSTAGGRGQSQFVGTNTFAGIGGSQLAGGVSITTAGASNLAVLASNDVVSSPMPASTLVPLVTGAAAGLQIA
ncbi:MAG: hypothetical protein AB9M53_00935 [Leptothrix sp. (in: b-proteobacteria)]